MARHCNPTAAKSTMIDGKINEVISQDAVLGTKLAGSLKWLKHLLAVE